MQVLGLSLGFEKAGIDVVMANEYKSIAESYIKNRRNKHDNWGYGSAIQDTFKSLLVKSMWLWGTVRVFHKKTRKSINDERNYLFKYFINVVSL